MLLPLLIVLTGMTSQTMSPDVDDYPHLPPLSDQQRFPKAHVARVQAELYGDHARWLSWMRCHNPDDGRYGVWIAQAHFGRRYWELLQLSHSHSHGEGFCRERLNDLLLLVGPEAYLGGWSPFALDPATTPRLRPPPEPVGFPPA